MSVSVMAVCVVIEVATQLSIVPTSSDRKSSQEQVTRMNTRLQEGHWGRNQCGFRAELSRRSLSRGHDHDVGKGHWPFHS